MDMRTLNEIRDEIDRLSARRGEVMRALSEGFDATLKSEHLELEEQIAELWDEQRFASYREYIAAYEADDPAFYAANDRRHQKALQPLRERDRALEELAEARREIERLRLQLEAASNRGLLGRLLGR